MKHFFNFLLFAFLIGAIQCYDSYRDYKVYDINPNQEQYDALYEWQNEDGVDFWRLYTPGRTSRVMISPERQNDFESLLSEIKLPYEITIEDMEVLIEEERQDMAKNRQGRAAFQNPANPDFSVFWSSVEMEAYADHLVRTYPNIVEKENLLFSPGGRNIYALKFSTGVFGNKPIIAMECGMHAREWAAPPTVLYLIHMLTQNATQSAELLARLDWLIVPMQNPDGYEHSRAVSRLWRQNRRQVTPTCIGVDLNRNWAYSWRTATVACGSQTYPGPSAMSEPETFALSEVMGRYVHNIKLYLSVHTFGDMVLWPWGYSGSPGWITTHPEHQALGNLWRNEILSRGGRPYIVGNVADVLGNAFGAVDDHMAGHYRVPYVYTLEITSGFQFQYPEARIQALVLETYWGYWAMAQHIAAEFN